MKKYIVTLSRLAANPCLEASEEAIGAGFRIEFFCARQENGGRIPDCLKWTERAWISAAGCSKAGLEAALAAGLVRWDGDALVVLGYESEHEAAYAKMRERGREGGKRTQEKARGARASEVKVNGREENIREGNAPLEGCLQGSLTGSHPAGFTVPLSRADGQPEAEDNDSDNPILDWLRSDEAGAVMQMGRQDLAQEWIDDTEGMSLAEVQATMALVRGSRTPLHFKDAKGKTPKPADGEGTPCASIRAWLKAQTGLASVYVKDANLFRLIQIYGPDTMLALGRHAAAGSGLDKDLLRSWYEGRKSSYGGWDYYEPKARLPAELTEDAVREIVGGVPV